MNEARLKVIDEVSRAGLKRAETAHKKTGKLINGQWYTLVHELHAGFNDDEFSVPPQAIIGHYEQFGFPVHAALEKVTETWKDTQWDLAEQRYRRVTRSEQFKVWRIYVKIPAWELDRDWASVANPEWL